MIYDKKNKFNDLTLKESEHEIIDGLDIGFFRVSLDGTILAHNQKYNEIFGIDTLKSLNGEKTFNFWESQHDREEFLTALRENGKLKDYTVLAKKINGDTIVLQSNSHLIYDDNGLPIATEGTIIDITEKYNLQKELEESEKRYRDLAELLPDVIFETDAKLNLAYVNSITYEKFGYTKDDFKKDLSITQFIDNSYIKLASKNITTLLEGKETKPQEYLLIKKDGTKFYGLVHSRPIYNNENKEIIGIRGTITDINTLVLAEKELKESEIKFRRIFESIPDLFFLVSENSTILDFAGNQEDLYIQPEEFIGKRMSEILPPNLGPLINEYIKKTLETQKPHHLEYSLLIKNELRYFETRFLYFSKNNIAMFIRNISERKKTEAKLKESEEKFRTIAEQSLLGIAILQDNKFKYVNEKFAGVGGRSIDEVMGWKLSDFINTIHPEDKKIIIEYSKKRQQGIETERSGYECRCFKKNGDLMWLQTYSKSILFEGTLADQITLLDITNSKLAEQKLKESESKYHELFETSPDGVILTDLQGKIIECNTALEIISGYSSSYFIDKNFLELDLYQEDGLEQVKKGYRDLLGDQILDTVEFPIKTKENQIKWVQINSNLLDMKSKSYILTVIHDITSLKEAEKALKENEKKFRDILETSSVGVMELDVINKNLLYINPKLIDIIGYKKEEINEEVFRNKIIYTNDLYNLLKTNEEAELEFRISDKQGRMKWLAGKRIPHYNERGEIESIRVWLDDITEKKIYENLIYELNINFLNFTTDTRKNIDLLLNTCLKLLEGDLLLYVYKTSLDEQENYQIISSDGKTYNYSTEEFNKLFLSMLFREEHDFPQTFFDIDRMLNFNSDHFVVEQKFRGCFGKVIKSQDSLNSAVCVFYKNNPIVSGQDKLVMFLICDAVEIEQRRWQVQKDLEKQNITLNKINKLKSELFSRTSHELKTPLISVKGFTELLLTLYTSKLDPEIISILEEIRDGSKRLEKIINLLLDSTKLEAGQLSLNLHNEDLTFLIKFCVKELQGIAKLRDQTISLNLHDKLKTKFDKERIYEVISNLLVNAIKYTPPGGKIIIETKKNKESYTFSIQDDGIGFTEEEKSMVFKQFGKIERYGQGWDIAADGTGLGLYITKKLVELHGGKIWLESEGRNKGTTFYFSIPILK